MSESRKNKKPMLHQYQCGIGFFIRERVSRRRSEYHSIEKFRFPIMKERFRCGAFRQLTEDTLRDGKGLWNVSQNNKRAKEIIYAQHVRLIHPKRLQGGKKNEKTDKGRGEED